MHKNPLWLALLASMTLFVIGYSTFTIYHIWIEYPLQKSFPIKECLYMLILWGILAYFIGLGFYIGEINKGK